MAANSSNRQTSRDKMASILTTALSGQVQAVYGYKIRSLIALGKGPFVTVDGSTSNRPKNKLGGNSYDNDFRLNVTTFVLWSDGDSNWDEHNCEDRQDLLEKLIADAVLDHKSKAQDATVPWDTIILAGPTIQDAWIEGGKVWWTETIPVQVRIFNA